ncbi:xanthine dehydrogenase accessory protein XdhC [Ferrovibrio sp.]|jgi:xanthine dehydrogenase accessory factor|uniref:xanthine dehydrogenase accessory protein XdhC n=1 Tax=Ferrovibrio sp. TaxID=1917215 RepID=UPI0035AEA41A
MTSHWLNALTDLEARGVPAVLVTVAATEGSAPREAGTKMVVTPDDAIGTIGGGTLEFRAIDIARQMLAGKQGPSLRKFPLGPSMGQCCGGTVTLLFEPQRPDLFTIALFGAGHVGKAMVQVLSALPCKIRWFDPRPDAFPDHVPPGVEIEITNAPERDVAGLPDNAWLLIMSHSHALDLGIAAKALQENRFSFVGLIGSETKRARFVKRFRELGLDDAQLARLTCPIGIDGISGKHPGEIAIATAAQLLELREAQKQTLRVVDESAAE